MNERDYVIQSKDRRPCRNAFDTNCDIVRPMNLDLEGEMIASRKSSSADTAMNPDRKMNRNISGVEKCIPVFYDGMPHNIQQQARLELNETDENIQKGILMLKAYMEKEKLPLLDDDYLITCLRLSKYEWEKAQEKLKRLIHFRRKMADAFEKLDLDTARQVIRKNMTGFLPYRDGTGRAIFFTRGVDWYPEICDSEELVATTFMIIFYLISIPITTVCGMRYLCDLQARNYSQYYQYYKIFKAHLSNSNKIPVRLHVDAVNDNPSCHWIFRLLRPLLPTKIVERLRLHGYSYESLHAVIDASVLPKEYGGTMGPLNNEFMMEKFEEFFHKFKAQNALFMKH